MRARAQELGAALHSALAEMESSQAVQAVFTSIITALLRSLMLPDNGAGAQTALGCCGSQRVPGIMPSVHPQDRMFTLTGLRVSRCDRINTSVTLRLLTLSPAQPSHPQLPHRDTLASPKPPFDPCDTERLMVVVAAVRENSSLVTKKRTRICSHGCSCGLGLPGEVGRLSIFAFYLKVAWKNTLF